MTQDKVGSVKKSARSGNFGDSPLSWSAYGITNSAIDEQMEHKRQDRQPRIFYYFFPYSMAKTLDFACCILGKPGTPRGIIEPFLDLYFQCLNELIIIFSQSLMPVLP
jgi:hypothetical protein